MQPPRFRSLAEHSAAFQEDLRTLERWIREQAEQLATLIEPEPLSTAEDTAAVPQSRTVTAGAGLTGGGALSSNITLNVGAGDGITVNADDVEVDETFAFQLTGDVDVKLLNNVRYAHMYATGGSGTSGSPWTGWEGTITSETRTPLYFAPGYYSVDSAITITATAEVSLIGHEGANIVRGGAYNGDLITFSNACNGILIQGLIFDNQTNAADCIVIANNSTNVDINNCRFEDMANGTAIKLNTGGSLTERVRIHNNHIESASGSANIRAIDLNDFGADCDVTHNTIIKTGAISMNPSSSGTTGYRRINVSYNDFKQVDASNILVRSWDNPESEVGNVSICFNKFEDAGLTQGKGFIVAGENAGSTGAGADYYRVVIIGNQGRGYGNSTGSGLGITVGGASQGADLQDVLVAFNNIDGRQADGTQQNCSYGIYLAESVRNAVICNNTIKYLGRSGITVSYTDFCNIHDNIIEYPCQYAAASSPPTTEMGGIQIQTNVTECRIHHNHILNPGLSGGTSNGIFIRNDNTNDRISIDHNDIIDDRGTAYMDYAIFKGATATNVYAFNNDCRGGTNANSIGESIELETTFNERALFEDFISIGTQDLLTIDGDGAITITGTAHRIETNGGAASDNLDTITGGSSGDWLLLRATDTTHTVVVRDDDNIRPNGSQCILDDDQKTILLMLSGSVWVEISRGNIHTFDNNIVMSDNSITGVDTITFTDVNGTIAGIQNQNLVDKTQDETISGAWTYSASINLSGGSSSLVMDGGDISGLGKVYSDSTTVPFEFVSLRNDTAFPVTRAAFAFIKSGTASRGLVDFCGSAYTTVYSRMHTDGAFYTAQDVYAGVTDFTTVPPSGGTKLVRESRQVIAGTLLTGGGALSSDVTLNVDEASIDHGSIAGLTDDDHTHYVPIKLTTSLSGTANRAGTVEIVHDTDTISTAYIYLYDSTNTLQPVYMGATR